MHYLGEITYKMCQIYVHSYITGRLLFPPHDDFLFRNSYWIVPLQSFLHIIPCASLFLIKIWGLAHKIYNNIEFKACPYPIFTFYPKFLQNLASFRDLWLKNCLIISQLRIKLKMQEIFLCFVFFKLKECACCPCYMSSLGCPL